ncbi:exg1 [Symbiodinium sp. CCMP2456]|nr:exg1 [Symbiodinium sp. CCMP2456]
MALTTSQVDAIDLDSDPEKPKKKKRKQAHTERREPEHRNKAPPEVRPKPLRQEKHAEKAKKKPEKEKKSKKHKKRKDQGDYADVGMMSHSAMFTPMMGMMRSMSYGVMPGMTMMMNLCLHTLSYIFLIIVLCPPLLHVTIGTILTLLWLLLLVLLSALFYSFVRLSQIRESPRFYQGHISYAQVEARG